MISPNTPVSPMHQYKQTSAVFESCCSSSSASHEVYYSCQKQILWRTASLDHYIILTRVLCITTSECVLSKKESFEPTLYNSYIDISSRIITTSTTANDLTIGWQNWNLLSHPNATLTAQARLARTSGENLNYMTLAPQPRQARPSGEKLNYSLSR